MDAERFFIGIGIVCFWAAMSFAVWLAIQPAERRAKRNAKHRGKL